MKDLKYSNRALLQLVDDYMIEHMSNFSAAEQVLVIHVFDVTNEQDLALLAKEQDKQVVLALSELEKIYATKGARLVELLEQAAIGLMSRYTIIRNLKTNASHILPLITGFRIDDQQVIISFSSSYIPLLLDIKQKNPNGRWRYAIKLNSSNAASLYKVLQRYQGEIYFTIDELKNAMNLIGNYDRYNNFKQKVLDAGIREINNKTDIKVQWEAITVNRKVEKLKFNIKDKIAGAQASAGQGWHSLLEVGYES